MNLKEIASLAHVSQAAVSIVLNNRKGVSDEKRTLITKLLTENGYKINNTSNETEHGIITLLKIKKHAKLVEGNPGFVTEIIDAIEKQCKLLDYDLMISNCKIEEINETVKSIKQNSGDGVLILGTEINADDNLDILKTLSVPIVIIDNCMLMTQYSSITMNNAEAIFLSVNHLFELGHKEIGFLANKLPSANCLARFEGYKDALKQLNISYNDNYVFNVLPTPEGAYESIKLLLESGVRFPHAIVANNDSIALGAMKAFKERKIRVPEDISIVGFDNIPFSAISDPPLTTIDVKKSAIAKIAVKILTAAIEEPNSSALKILINTNLLVRGSTCKFSD